MDSLNVFEFHILILPPQLVSVLRPSKHSPMWPFPAFAASPSAHFRSEKMISETFEPQTAIGKGRIDLHFSFLLLAQNRRRQKGLGFPHNTAAASILSIQSLRC